MALSPLVRDPEDNGHGRVPLSCAAVIRCYSLSFSNPVAWQRFLCFSPKNARPSKVPTFGAQPLMSRLGAGSSPTFKLIHSKFPAQPPIEVNINQRTFYYQRSLLLFVYHHVTSSCRFLAEPPEARALQLEFTQARVAFSGAEYTECRLLV